MLNIISLNNLIESVVRKAEHTDETYNYIAYIPAYDCAAKQGVPQGTSERVF